MGVLGTANDPRKMLEPGNRPQTYRSNLLLLILNGKTTGQLGYKKQL